MEIPATSPVFNSARTAGAQSSSIATELKPKGETPTDAPKSTAYEQGRAWSTPTAKTQKAKAQQDEQALIDQQLIRQLSARDREVRAHEQAHAAIGGPYAGAPQYQFQRGPDGVNYAVGGEVRIDTSKAATPEATLQKANLIRRAALAPAEPSAQDRQVAAEAAQMALEAMQQLAAAASASRAQAGEGSAIGGDEQGGSVASPSGAPAFSPVAEADKAEHSPYQQSRAIHVWRTAQAESQGLETTQRLLGQA